MSMTTASVTLGKQLDPASLQRGVAWKRDIARKQEALAEAVRASQREVASCPVCEGVDRYPYTEVYGYPYVECAACGHLYLARAPSPEAVHALYVSERAETKSVQADIYAVRGLFEKRVAAIAVPKVAFVTRQLGKAGRWIDVGSGVGEVVVAAQRAGWDALGLEIDAEEVKFAASVGAKVECVELDDRNAKDLLCGADVVSLLNVVEHAAYPVDLVGRIARHMPGGCRLVIEVPRHPSISSFAVKCVPGAAHRHIYPPDHLHIFSDASMDRLLARCGLDAEHVWRFGQDAYEMIMSLACAGGAADVDVDEAVLATVPALQDAIDRRGLSDVQFVIARKK